MVPEEKAMINKKWNQIIIRELLHTVCEEIFNIS